MYAQLRTYTVNRGKMEVWLELFRKHVQPLAHQAGHIILGPWLNEDKTEFVWVRTYDSAADAKAKDEAFYGNAEWKAVLPQAMECIAKPRNSFTSITSAGSG